MKKLFTLLAVMLMTVAAAYAQDARQKEAEERKEKRDAERAKIKAEENAEEMAAFQEAIQALKANEFVLEANQAVMQNGQSLFVDSSTNFVMVNGDRGTVQTAFNSPNPGPNGLGGVTLDGTVSNVEMSMDKHGNVYYSFSIQGVNISAQVFVSMSEGSSSSSATINPNFNPNTLTLNGNIVPLQQSDVFKGSSW